MSQVDGKQIAVDRLLLASGSTTQIPPIPGLADVPYLTHETAFSMQHLPDSLLVLGGGVVALECAQMVRMLAFFQTCSSHLTCLL